MSALRKTVYTLEEYYALDAASEERLEYWRGEIFNMSGVSEKHDRLESNLHILLRLALRGRPCRVFLANMRLKVPAMPPYRYADGSALCGIARFQKVAGVDVLVNPALIIEVLSPSTEDYDRNLKFEHYKSIESLREYVLVEQDRPRLSLWQRDLDTADWRETVIEGLDSMVSFECVGCTLSVRDIYEDV